MAKKKPASTAASQTATRTAAVEDHVHVAPGHGEAGQAATGGVKKKRGADKD